ncbi:MAG: UDP-N-acetylmuramoyl-tripeptide--D-alanyl-D-alanine ligase [Actinobacteria bacterium]|nr:UDP-N-acetylmuramoyl-tripeptide--D-alanyl-D-alanine ligase [Actinomycetota bacterium]
MIALSLEDVRELVAGELAGAGPITGVQIDSRRVRPGDLFVAVGRGAEYLADARAAGAAATLVPDAAEAALAALGGAVRARSAATVVAITGSTGKTSAKDILAALCAPHRRTVAAEVSFNNELGVPLTLCRLEPDTEVCIVELGMRGFGQIAALCAFAKPHIGLITHVGPVHLELVGSVEGVARAKAEVVACLPPGGIAIAPLSPLLDPFLARDDVDVRRFDPAAVELAGDRGRFDVRGTLVELELPFTARHQAENTLAALYAYEALGLPLARAQEGVAAIAFSPWRGEELPLAGGGFVVNDAYNANPTSMRAALLHLCERAAGRRRVAILGEMAELGEEGPRYHREIGALLRELGIEVLVAIGPLARGYMEPGVETMRWLDHPAGFDDLIRPGDAVLVKASRAAGLEGIAPTLANESDG